MRRKGFIVLVAVIVIAASVIVVVAAPWESQEPSQEWRIEWRGSKRFLMRDGVWHIWSRDSRWVELPAGWSPDGPR